MDNSKGGTGNHLGEIDNTGIQSVFSKDTDRTLLHNLLFMNSEQSGNLRFTNVNTINQTINTTEWIHVAFVISKDKLAVYANGVLQEEKNITSPNFSEANTKNLYIGQLGSDWYPLFGTLDEFRMYKRALNSFEIQAVYQYGLK